MGLCVGVNPVQTVLAIKLDDCVYHCNIIPLKLELFHSDGAVSAVYVQHINSSFYIESELKIFENNQKMKCFHSKTTSPNQFMSFIMIYKK